MWGKTNEETYSGSCTLYCVVFVVVALLLLFFIVTTFLNSNKILILAPPGRQAGRHPHQCATHSLNMRADNKWVLSLFDNNNKIFILRLDKNLCQIRFVHLGAKLVPNWPFLSLIYGQTQNYYKRPFAASALCRSDDTLPKDNGKKETFPTKKESYHKSSIAKP